jgi:hypothetical protein
METVWYVLAGMAVLAGVAVTAAGTIVLFLRLRSREPIQVNLRLVLRVYLHVALVAGLLVLMQGVAGLVRTGFAEAWGNEFSYTPVYVPLPEDRTPFVPNPLELRDPRTLSEAEQEELSRILADREAMRLELEERRQVLGLDRAKDESILEGASFSIIGAVIVGAHLAGIRGLAGRNDQERTLARVFFLGATIVFGLVTVFSLPEAVYDSLRYAFLDPLEDFGYRYQPGEKLALALVATPVWLLFLWLSIKSVRAAEA